MVFGLDRGIQDIGNFQKRKKKGVRDYGNTIVHQILLFQFRASHRKGKEESLFS